MVLFDERDVQTENHENDQIFENVVAERALKLRDEKAPKTAKRVLVVLIHAAKSEA
jgi:hypothetical protein